MILEIILIICVVLIFFSLLTTGWGISVYNSFATLKQDIYTQFSNIKTEYQRRIDLVLNLVESVKSFKKHERETLTKVIQARNQGFTGNIQQDMKKMKGLDGLFARLLAISEQYPKLMAGEQHNKLMDELRITEDRINVARTAYNDIVNTYNAMAKRFPTNLIAGMFRFKLEEYFKGEEGSEKAPKINLD